MNTTLQLSDIHKVLCIYAYTFEAIKMMSPSLDHLNVIVYDYDT